MKNTRGIIIGIIAILGTAIFFLVPFVFVFLIASKPLAEANLLQFSWPEQFVLFDNLRQALQTRDYLLVIAYINSFILTIVSVTGLVIFASMVAYVWQRRASRLSPVISISGAGRLDRATCGRSHDLGATNDRAVQDHARSDLH